MQLAIGLPVRLAASQHLIAKNDQFAGQGDPGDLFYLIRNGTVDVRIHDGRQEKKVAELTEGQYFGEAALITNEPRNATVIAKEESVFYALEKKNFRTVLEQSASFEEELRQALFNRQ